MSSTADAGIRRSTRERRQATTYYDEAKKHLTDSAKKSRKRKKEITDDEEEEEEEEEEEMEEEEEQDSDDGEEEEVVVKKRRTPSKKTKKKQPTSGKKSPSSKPRGRRASKGKRTAQPSLLTLAKKVLEEEETPENSLLASLLHSGQRNNKKDNTRRNNKKDTKEQVIQDICRKVIQKHKQDPIAAQIELLNLIFRCVGGTSESILPDDSDLEEITADEWGEIVTHLVDDMSYTALESVLICASTDADRGAAITEFRGIYDTFWFQLAKVALTEATTTTAATQEDASDDDDDDGSAEDKPQPNSSKFAIEMVSDWIMRLNELTSVGQPDIRLAAVVGSIQLSNAVLARSNEIQQQMEITLRQLHAATKSRTKLSSKAETLQFKLDSLTRTRQELEQVVEGNFAVVFMNRHRDSNAVIRTVNVQSLATMTLERPDLYLMDKYLKYIGWALSDKAPSVRKAALAGLSAPFLVNLKAPKSAIDSRKASKIEISSMEKVIKKFLPRIVDCTIDKDIRVQEEATGLLVLLGNTSFLEDLDDDNMWEQVNNRALASDTSPKVRRDALYFVVDQIEHFDTVGEQAEEEGRRNKTWSRDKSASLSNSVERTAAQQLNTLGDWLGSVLSDGPIPVDKMRIELADYIIDSLRSMPEYSALATNWGGMLRAIRDENVAMDQGEEAEERADIAKQRVLVRFLAHAAKAEVAAIAKDFLYEGVDPEAAEIEANVEGAVVSSKKKTSKKNNNSHETLSLALLKAMPELLLKFKSDPINLSNVTSLPRLLLPSVLSLPQRKSDVRRLLKTLAELYTESGNEVVLSNISEALVYLSQGDHVRAEDAQSQLETLVKDLSNKAIELFSSDDDDKEEDSSKEHSISLCLRRLQVLAKRYDVASVLVQVEQDDDQNLLEVLFDTVVAGLSEQLEARKIVTNDEEEDDDDEDEEGEKHSISVPEIWTTEDNRDDHEAVADSVCNSLSFLLAATCWSLIKARASDPTEMEDFDEKLDTAEDIEDHPVAKQRDQIMELLRLCCNQFLPPMPQEDDEEAMFTDEHIAFSDRVQVAAAQAFGDLRVMFPKAWAQAASPLLRACALSNEAEVIGGCVRFFRTKEAILREQDEHEVENLETVWDLLYPVCRNLIGNWKLGNRREAGYAMSHIVGSGHEAQKMLTVMSRMAKKIDPIRLLETHMACLRTSFDDWVDNEPDELESDRPTDEEMAAFEAIERQYNENFTLIVQQAGRLSQSLGVGKLDPKLQDPLSSFVMEGVRYSFSTEVPGEEDMLPGSRLTFLTLIGKYTTWIRRKQNIRDPIVQYLQSQCDELRDDPLYDEVLDSDKEALASFRKCLGMQEDIMSQSKSPRSTAGSQFSEDEEMDDDEHVVDKAPRRSQGSTGKRNRHSSPSGSIGSASRSKASVAPSLSPLLEEDDDSLRAEMDTPAKEEETDDDSLKEEIDSPPVSKRRKIVNSRRSSVRSAITTATMERTGTFDEDSESD